MYMVVRTTNADIGAFHLPPCAGMIGMDVSSDVGIEPATAVFRRQDEVTV